MIDCVCCKNTLYVDYHHHYPYDSEKESWEVECDACGKTSGKRKTLEKAKLYWQVNNIPLDVRTIILERYALEYINRKVKGANQ